MIEYTISTWFATENILVSARCWKLNGANARAVQRYWISVLGINWPKGATINLNDRAFGILSSRYKHSATLNVDDKGDRRVAGSARNYTSRINVAGIPGKMAKIRSSLLCRRTLVNCRSRGTTESVINSTNEHTSERIWPIFRFDIFSLLAKNYATDCWH